MAWRMWPIVLLAVCSGCGQPTPPVVPTALRVCPDKAIPPPALPPVVGVDRLNTAHTAERSARKHDEASFDECRRRLDRLNAWIDEHPPAR